MTDKSEAGNCIIWSDANRFEQTLHQLKDDGFYVIEFECRGSVIELFREFKQKLPLDPPISGNVNWDAFTDSLWSGINDLENDLVALVWRDAWKLRQADNPSFEIAQEVLSTVACQLTAGAYGASRRKVVRVILVQET